ncbi:MAG: hypothetical protein RL318_100 [Fibrobacterota bacterium]|jgi:D-glycero-D-manno-heptose 1,7-bisphosphate phosphatase
MQGRDSGPTGNAGADGSKFILLDRDGVLNEDLPGSLCRLEDLRMIPGAAQAVALLNAQGFQVLVITNQACVGRGQLSMGTLDAIHAEMERQVQVAGGRIEAWFICAHRSEEKCSCRKPLPGLLLAAQARYGFPMAETWFVGDAGRDIEASIAAGCRPALVLTGKGGKTQLEHPGIPAFADLLAFARSNAGGVQASDRE